MDTQFENLKNPLEVLPLWLEEHKKTTPPEPLAMVVSTVDERGRPSSRVLLLKDVQTDHLVFFTNYQAPKGTELEKTPFVALNFFFESSYRQVRIEGECQKTSRSISEEYWRTRPRESQISQWVSQQSKAVANRDELKQRIQAATEKFENNDVPCPAHWGGYQVTPDRIEYWIGRDHRLHDRFNYTKVEGSWNLQRLCP